MGCGDLEASEACRDRAFQERDKSRAQTADADLKSSDAAKTISEVEASVSAEKELRLATEAVKMKAENERLRRKTKGYKRSWRCGRRSDGRGM